MKKATSLQDLGKAYQTLTKGNRLFIPARAVREFANNRERSLGDLINALNNQKSSLSSLVIPVILKDMDGYREAADALTKLQKSHSTAVAKLVTAMRSWQGNDPVSQLYHTLFDKRMIVDLPQDERASGASTGACSQAPQQYSTWLQG
jgi:hypothetical protein